MHENERALHAATVTTDAKKFASSSSSSSGWASEDCDTEGASVHSPSEKSILRYAFPWIILDYPGSRTMLWAEQRVYWMSLEISGNCETFTTSLDMVRSISYSLGGER